jgi:ATP-dependent helicase/nuclease subunit B
MTPDPGVPALLTQLDRATRAYPYDRKLLVGSRPAEGRELLRALSLSGRAWVGWDPRSLRQLAHEVVATDVARQDLGTADGFDVMALVDHAIDAVEAAGGASPFGAGVPAAYRDPLRRTVEALRLAGLDGPRVAAGAGSDPKLGLLAAVLSAYEALLTERKLLDGPALIALAADALGAAGAPDALGAAGAPGALGAGGAPGALGAGSVPAARVFLLPGLSLRGVEGRLVRALLDHGATVLTPDPVAGLDAPAGRLWVASSGPGGPLSTLHALDRDGDHESGPRDLHLFAAATPADELREVIRRVMAAGIPWDRVEVVAVDSATYGTALDSLARRLGIPATHSAGLPVSRTRVGRAADAYFRWIADRFPVEPIRQLLANDDLSAPSADGPSPAALARRLRRLRIGWGYDRYLPVLDRALAAADRTDAPRDGDGDEEAAALARERERAELRSLRALLEPILVATPAPGGRDAEWTARTSPAELATGLLALLERVPAGDAVENTARTVLVQRLERARATLTRQTTWLAATGILRARLDTRIAATADAGRVAPWTSTGGHLHLSDVTMGGLTGRPYTFVVGLSAGAMSAGTDPLLTDGDRARLNRAAGRTLAEAGPLASTGERIDESRHVLAAMLARLRGRVTLSYAAWDTAEGRTIGPAPELLQALRLRESDPTLTYEDLRVRLGRLASAVPDPAAVPLADRAVGPHDATGLVDSADVWLAALATLDGRLRDGRDAVRALYTGLDRGLAAADAAAGDRLTAHHGLVPSDAGTDPLADDAVLSASRLETLGQCQLRYFYQYVLGARPVRDPEYDPEQWLDALERGSLLHVVYERALGELPAGVDYADEAFQAHALRILDDEVRRTLDRLPAPNRVVLDAERAALVEDVRSFVAMIRDHRPNVIRTELAFGPDPDAEGVVELEVGGGRAGGLTGGPHGTAARLRLRGRVDRLDALDTGGLRVVDYKTGRRRGYHSSSPFDGGRRLQHFLYSLAVERLRPGKRVERAEYHFPTRRGENDVRSYSRAELDRGHHVLATLLDMARRGRFLATESRDDCRYCDFAAVCRVSVNEWGGAESPRADWARIHAPGFPEYGPLLRLRADDPDDA